MRKLASIQSVSALTPIPGADMIETAHVQGWTCVVKKGEFQVGDLGVYLEVDSIPPDLPIYRFLWTKKGERAREGARPAKYRIKTMRLRGQLSQGLLLPLTSLLRDDLELEPGTDVTEQLGVIKYEPELPSKMGSARAAFPSLVPKTDEERVQSAPGVLEEIAGQPYVITVKCDGTSSTFVIDQDDDSFHACGRNWSILEGDNAYWSIARRYDIEAKLRKAGGRYALQGEIVGPGIQKNPMGLGKLSWFCFNAYDVIERRHLSFQELHDLLEELDLPMVPVVEVGDSFSYDLAEILNMADGLYEDTANKREGIVVRTLQDCYSPTLNSRLSFKAISNAFLLAEKD